MANLAFNSVVQLPSHGSRPSVADTGHPLGSSMPLLGLGIRQNDDAKPAALAALKSGYKRVDAARMYHNEKQASEAVKESSVPREQISQSGAKNLEEVKAAGLEFPAANQVEICPFCQQREIVDYWKTHGIVVEAYSPLVGEIGMTPL
ncbi:hypothetical protein V8D89_011194 [Ganoderma adspersum]